MFKDIWTVVLYQPLLNALAFLASIMPQGDIGLAVIALTILVKLVLFPLTQKSIESQAQMNLLTPELSKIKASGVSKEEQARMTFDLYKKHKTNPFSGCLLILIQIPIIFALYFVFFNKLDFSNGLLYSFVRAPESMNMLFLGLINIGEKGIILAILAGASQYLQAHFMPKPHSSPLSKDSTSSFAESFGKSMHMQMKYVFPFLIAFIAYSSGVIAIYFIVSNIFAVFQQIYAERKDPIVVKALKGNE